MAIPLGPKLGPRGATALLWRGPALATPWRSAGRDEKAELGPAAAIEIMVVIQWCWCCCEGERSFFE